MIPPLMGFFGKLMILYAVTHNGNFFLAFIAILVSVISAAYYLSIIKVIHFDSLNLTALNDKNKMNEFEKTKSDLSKSDFSSLGMNSFVIATITLMLIFFILNPTLLLNSVHLFTLSLFCW